MVHKIPRVPESLSPRPNWDPPPPLSPAGEGVGESQYGRLEKKPSFMSTLWYAALQNADVTSLR